MSRTQVFTLKSQPPPPPGAAPSWGRAATNNAAAVGAAAGPHIASAAASARLSMHVAQTGLKRTRLQSSVDVLVEGKRRRPVPVVSVQLGQLIPKLPVSPEALGHGNLRESKRRLSSPTNLPITSCCKRTSVGIIGVYAVAIAKSWAVVQPRAVMPAESDSKPRAFK